MIEEKMREIENLNDVNFNYLLDNEKEMTPKSKSKGIFADRGSIKPSSRGSIESRLNRFHHEVVHSPFGNSFTITQKEVSIIRGIIDYMDSKSTIALGLPSNQKHLKEEGKKVDHVHPLCFIWSILSDTQYREKVKGFKENSAFALKWNGFLGYSSFHDKGFGRNMEKFYNHRDPREFRAEFESFYRSLNLKPEIMDPHLQAKNWRGFAAALVDPNSYL